MRSRLLPAPRRPSWMKSRRPLNPRPPAASPSLPDTRVVRNLGRSGIDMERAADPAALFCISGSGRSLSGALLVFLLRPPTDTLDSIAGDPECRFGDPDAAVQHDLHFGVHQLSLCRHEILRRPCPHDAVQAVDIALHGVACVGSPLPHDRLETINQLDAGLDHGAQVLLGATG